MTYRVIPWPSVAAELDRMRVAAYLRRDVPVRLLQPSHPQYNGCRQIPPCVTY